MSTPVRSYARIYHDVVDDPGMAPVYANDLAWSTWTKLLLIGDQAWPSSGFLPAGISRPGLKVCVESGAVIVDGIRFRIRGMDDERNARSEKARRAANALHSQPSSSANGVQPQPLSTANGVPNRTEPNRTEPSQAGRTVENDEESPTLKVLRAQGRVPG